MLFTTKGNLTFHKKLTLLLLLGRFGALAAPSNQYNRYPSEAFIVVGFKRNSTEKSESTNKIYALLIKFKNFLSNKENSTRTCICTHHHQSLDPIHATLHEGLELLDKIETLCPQQTIDMRAKKVLLLINQAKKIRQTLQLFRISFARTKKLQRECPIDSAIWETIQYFDENLELFITRARNEFR
jgi:hypothetical protein